MFSFFIAYILGILETFKKIDVFDQSDKIDRIDEFGKNEGFHQFGDYLKMIALRLSSAAPTAAKYMMTDDRNL